MTLDLSKNHMDDAAVSGIMDALRANEEMQIQVGLFHSTLGKR